MSYEILRPQIKDGDIIFFAHGDSIWSHLTEFGTHSKFYHVAIAFWMLNPGPRLMVLEAHQGGRRIVSLSSYAAKEMEVVRLDESVFDWNKVGDVFLEKAGAIQYSIMEYVAIGMREIFGIKMQNFPGEVCSELVASAVNYSQGSDAVELTTSPARLYKTILHFPGTVTL